MTRVGGIIQMEYFPTPPFYRTRGEDNKKYDGQRVLLAYEDNVRGEQ